MRILKMRCKCCGYYNRVSLNKIFIKPDSPQPKVGILIPMYEPLKVVKCKKCGKLIAEPKELIRIVERI
jgi:hypothetical protein